VQLGHHTNARSLFQKRRGENLGDHGNPGQGSFGVEEHFGEKDEKKDLI
jgi:hypothetical protein